MAGVLSTIVAVCIIRMNICESSSYPNITIDYNNSCPARDDANLTNYKCDGFQCGVASCNSELSAPVRSGVPVGVDVEEWCNYPWYDGCTELIDSGVYEKNLSIVARENRTRYQVTSLTTEQAQALQIAYTCSNLIKGGGEKSNYDFNSIQYITTYHGLPGWFESCSTVRQANAKGTCCVHHSPQFWTWHRLYMVQFENSLRQWDNTIGLPYFGWVDYVSDELPSLFTNITFEYNNETYRNLFYIYQTSDASMDNWTISANQTANQDYCQYTKTTATDGFLSITNPNTGYSLYKEIYNSMFFKSFIASDLPGEIPHDNVHDLLFGNMANLDISSLTPIFMTHHSAVEKYWLIWYES